MDFRKETRGEKATKNVEQVVCFYDNSVARKDNGDISVHYAEVWGHPDSEIGKGQTNLAMVSQRNSETGKYSHGIPLYPAQVEAIKTTAGDNHVPLLDKEGNAVGTIYGIRSDLMGATRDGKAIGFMPNTKTLQPSELSVGDVNGDSIRTRIFAAMAETKAIEEAAKKAAEAPAVEAPVAETKAPKARASRAKATVAAAAPSADEPELG